MSSVLVSHCCGRMPEKAALKAGRVIWTRGFRVSVCHLIHTPTSGKRRNGGASILIRWQWGKGERELKKKSEQNIAQRAAFSCVRPAKSLLKHLSWRDLALGPSLLTTFGDSSDPKLYQNTCFKAICNQSSSKILKEIEIKLPFCCCFLRQSPSCPRIHYVM